jgi:hypothetical protein
VHGDMRELKWAQRFDRIVNWANGTVRLTMIMIYIAKVNTNAN